MDLIKEIRSEIEKGHPSETAQLIKKALVSEIPVEDIVNEAMLPAMRTAGECIRREDSNLPLLLAAAKSVRIGFDIIEEECEDYQKGYLGTVILGTVEGDLHDVGKNLVGLMLRSEGFQVIDLGVDISEKQFLKAIKDNPDAAIICVSSLLTTSQKELERVVKKLKSIPNHKYKIMIGGGAVTADLAMKLGADAYTETAVDAAVQAKKFLMQIEESGAKEH